MRLSVVIVTGCLLCTTVARGDQLRPRPQSVRVVHTEASANPVMGPRYAPVTIDFFINLSVAPRVNLSAYQKLLELAKRHPKRLRLVFRLLDNPGVTILAEAVLEAHAQGRFFAIMEVLSIVKRRRVPHNADQIKALCESADVDVHAVEAAWKDERHHQTLRDNDFYRRRRRARSKQLVLLINGKQARIPANDISLSKLEAMYDEAYARAKVMLDRGADLEHVYDLSLLAEDAALEPVRVNAGRINGEGRSHRRVLYDAPLVSASARSGGLLVGDQDAPIAIHLYCDFALTYQACGDTKIALDTVLSHFAGGVRLYFHHMLPEELSEEQRRDTLITHAAAECAAAQDKFEDFYDQVYRRGHRLRRRLRRRSRLSYSEWLRRLVERVKLDETQYAACMDDPATSERIARAIRRGRAAGIEKSPTVIVGDRMYPGSKASDDIIRLVDIELMPGLLEQLAPDPIRRREWFPNARPRSKPRRRGQGRRGSR